MHHPPSSSACLSSARFPRALLALPLSIIVAAGLGVNPSARAQVEDVTELSPVVVTAARTAETADETLASVTVIDRAEIEQRQSKTMRDVLRGLPGVALSSTGGPGASTSLYLRGTESDHTLVLIDGIKVGSATTGAPPWQHIPVEQIERVEVVRGPRSSLYGSEAIGGVVQILTRRGQQGPLTPRLSLGAGTHNTIRASGGLSAGTERGWFDAGLGFEQTQGFNACDGEPFVGGCFVDQPDDDGYTNKNGRLSGGWDLADWLEVEASFMRSEGETEYDGGAFAGNRDKTALQTARLRFDLQPLAIWSSRIEIGRSWDDSKIYHEDDFLDRFDTRRDLLSWQNDIAVAPGHQLTLGVDHQRDQISTTLIYNDDARDNTGYFAQYLGRFGALDAQLSLRQDDNSQFGGHGTGSAALGYRFGNGLRLSASYGTAFKAPTFNELYFPGFGNPDLKPEQSRTAEVGLAGGHPWGRWAANLYQTDVDELIATNLVGTQYLPENIDESRIRGLELWTTAELSGWLLDANLTLLDPRNESEGPNNGNLLARRPEQTFRLDADRQFGRIGVGGTLFVSGRRFDESANRVRLDGYTLVDLRADYAFSDALRLQARVENLLDEDYETAAYYNQPGRTLFVSLLYQP
ncbi:TonB-dependent vitamin B12 receptor [Halochromatium glycolicum]|uniref:TonB-dependent vitamin B12 receptor n=1 Tax=Halochromatium glycolicum TaxID=85075 RepID=A0AAJ0X993_9GAMM|nr:TonB-dependent vitamin B12 receptor [Halochromatium glycolicum]MBK1703983.1 TonB-dependent vitamin B12 receptor [Halochromatium glycolicum]